MFKTLEQLNRLVIGSPLLNVNFKSGICANLLKSRLNVAITPQLTSSFHSSACLKQQKNTKNEEEIEDFASDLSSGLKNLERIGLVKSCWSWPKYNRTVYPPIEDGSEPIKNPVTKIKAK